MNIAFLSSRFPPDYIGGGEISTASIAEGLVRIGHKVTVFCGATKDAEETINMVRVIRSKELYGLWKKPLLEEKMSAAMTLVLKKLMKEDFEIIHAHDFRSALALSLLNSTRSVVTVRDFAPVCGTTNNLWFDGQSCDGCFWSNVLFRCHRVKEASVIRKPFRVWQYKYNLDFRNESYLKIKNHVYISNSLKNRISTRLTIPVNSAVIPNPINQDWLRPVKPMSDGMRILYAGTVEEYKGIRILIDAFSKLKEKFPLAEMRIAGNGKLDYYKKYAESLGADKSILFLGKLSQDNIIDEFDSASVIVQPSIWEEPFGRTVIEAGARGRAVVASNVGGIKETLQHNGGVLVEPNNAQALAEALINLFSNPQKLNNMGNTGRTNIEQHFSNKTIAEKYINFYKKSFDIV